MASSAKIRPVSYFNVHIYDYVNASIEAYKMGWSIHVLWAQTQNKLLQPGRVYAMAPDRTALADFFPFNLPLYGILKVEEHKGNFMFPLYLGALSFC